MTYPRSVIAWHSGRRLGVGDEFTTPHIETRWRVVRVRQLVRGRQGRRGFCTGSYDITLVDVDDLEHLRAYVARLRAVKRLFTMA